MTRRRRTVSQWVDGVRGGDRGVLAQAITLIESQRADDQALAREVIGALLPQTGRAIRLGISGVPGAGKSSLIEALGCRLTAQGKRLGVLAVDPSSTISGGSILGDKTRMPKLSVEPLAFIRPSPSALTLGGVARKTREALLLLEAAGFEVVLVETVGVGQSETAVAEMVDCFLLLLIAGAGDELQGIKRGVVELADLVVINKADGDGLGPARAAQREYAAALRYLRPRATAWTPRALAVSAKTGDGLDELWAEILAHRAALEQSGELTLRRKDQQVRWMWSVIEERLRGAFLDHPAVAADLARLEAEVKAGTRLATEAAEVLLRAFGL